MRRTLLGSALLLVVALSAASPARAAVSSEQAISFLNQQRAANGIPGDLAADSDLALGCRQHNRYMQATGRYDHGEDPSSPHYTPEGAGEGPYGGGSEVLAAGEGYDSAGTNPWEWAPIHLYLMLDPERTRAGYDASGGYACLRAAGDREGAEGAAEPQFFSYPGPGSVGIYPDEYASERPYTPQEVVGIPAGQATGTNILLFSLGTQGLEAESFSLRGPAGPVAARMVDEGTRSEGGSGGWFSGGGVLIPEQPLAEHTTYAVSVRWRNLAFAGLSELGGEDPLAKNELFTQEFSFTTGAMSGVSRERPERQLWRTPSLVLRRAGHTGKLLRLRLLADRVLWGRPARFVVYRYERGCGRRFASATTRCGWRRIGRRNGRVRLRRNRVLTLRPPARRQKATIRVRTRRFSSGETRIGGALAELTIRR